jgi:hypothetical protein
MSFTTSSLGKASTFPGGRSDFHAFQELRHLDNEEFRRQEFLTEEEPIVETGIGGDQIPVTGENHV